ncbi:unnamed protein product [Heligmosomoides polygyrus]|uniref:Neur_chan_LBD domain-containing protein n=1 Tax=Heligmosomoides polygyrus TaxID=6339 RepID=A0A183F410_HELPZ|nr:unnamed protein product [Heligmosomoides polygyrus]
MLLIVKNDFKPHTSAEVDMFCSAEVLNTTEEPELYDAVKKSMVHRRCGVFDPELLCMKDGKCSKKFPKELREATSVEFDGFPHLRRRRRSVISIDGIKYGDEWIDLYNPYLRLKYNSRINVEICAMITAVKYPINTFIKVRIGQGLSLEATKLWTRQHLNTRHVWLPEVAFCIFGYDLDDMSHTVIRLEVHLPEFQPVVFEEGGEEAALAREAVRDSTLTAYFKLSKQCCRIFFSSKSTQAHAAMPIDARQLYYSDVPHYFTFRDRASQPGKRGAKQVIGKMPSVSPVDTEIRTPYSSAQSQIRCFI